MAEKVTYAEIKETAADIRSMFKEAKKLALAANAGRLEKQNAANMAQLETYLDQEIQRVTSASDINLWAGRYANKTVRELVRHMLDDNYQF